MNWSETSWHFHVTIWDTSQWQILMWNDSSAEANLIFIYCRDSYEKKNDISTKKTHLRCFKSKRIEEEKGGRGGEGGKKTAVHLF